MPRKKDQIKVGGYAIGKEGIGIRKPARLLLKRRGSKKTEMGGCIAFIGLFLFVSGCATLTNDPNTPVTLHLSDGSNGICRVMNKRMDQSFHIPGTVMVPRSDDSLTVLCETDSGKTGSAIIPSEVEVDKITTSILFIDLGIVDSITDAHRHYPTVWVVPVTGRR